MSVKRAKTLGAAAVGTLAVAGAVSATVLSSGTAAASAGTVSAPASPVSASATQVDTMDSAQRVIRFEQVRFGLQGKIDLADAKAAVVKGSAAKAASDKASAAKAPARSATAPTRVRAAAARQPSEPSGSPQHVAEQMLDRFGWSSGQFSCLEPLWEHESGWNVTAENPSSGAYGIPQALSGSLMSSSGPDWQTNAATQIRWGLTYIRGRYGSPCGAWAHEEADNWY